MPEISPCSILETRACDTPRVSASSAWVERVEPGGHGLGELAVDTQPFQGGGQASQDQ